MSGPSLRRELAAVGAAVIVACGGLAAWSRVAPRRTPWRVALLRPALDAPIDTIPGLRTDTLPNGLRYYILENATANRRAEVRLVVDAGSVLEDDDQRGLAHAVEHMVFRGTRDFPGHAIDEYLESLGMRRGEGANAFTTLDETVFRLTVPADRPRVLDSALAMLAGMAHDALFEPAEAHAEAGVVLEEWRSKRDAGQRVADERQAILLAGSHYAGRPVIGDTAVLRRFDLRAMRRFYDRWYRPEAMAVIVVGTIDADAAQDLVAQHFGRLPRGPAPFSRTGHDVIRAAGVRAAVLDDAEAVATRVAVWHPRPPTRYHVRADYRTALVAGLWRAILSARLEQAAAAPGSPVVSGGVDLRSVARPLAAEVVGVSAAKGRAMASLDVLAAEMAHLAREGATRQEVDEHAAIILEQARASAESGEASVDLAAEFVDHFLTGNAPVSQEAAYELTRDLLPTIHPEDVTAFARRRALDSGSVVILTAPTDDAAAAVRPDELIARARGASTHAVAAHDPPRDPGPLLSRRPTPGRIVSERPISDVQAWDWRLSNGMRVILKPSRFAFDEIQFRAVAPGGASLASDADYPSAWLSDVIVQSTGIGPLTGPQLSRLIDTTSMALAPSVTDDAIALSGSTAPRDLDTFFELVHLYLTAPRRDTIAFRRYRDRMVEAAGHRDRDPDAIFQDTLAAVLAGHHPRALRATASFYESARLPSALAFWTDRLSNAAGVTVVLTGDFTLKRMRPLVERYLGSLPAGHAEQPRDVGLRGNAVTVRRDVVAGIAGRARTRIVLSGPIGMASRDLEDLKEVRDVLEIALDQRLRETLGGTYGVTVEADIGLQPPVTYTIAADFESSPERIDSLAAVALAEIERLRDAGPTDAEFTATRTARIHDYDGKLENTAYWTSELSYHSRLGWPLSSIATHRVDVEGLTPADLRRACAAYLSTRRYTRVTLRPRTRMRP